MRTDLVTLDLSLRRRSLIAYTVGMALYTFVIVALYPSFRNTTSLNNLIKGNSAASALLGLNGTLTSPSGWLNANIYDNFLPLIMLLLTVGYGAAAIAGQDEDGTLALLAVLPLRRGALLAQKAGALAIQSLILAAAVGVLTLIGRSFELTLSPAHVLEVAVAVFLLGLDFGLLALAIGAATGHRGFTLGVTTAIAAVSYLLSSLAPVVHWLRPGRYLSLLYWSIGNDQLANGVSGLDAAVLVGVSICGLGASIAAFRTLDLH